MKVLPNDAIVLIVVIDIDRSMFPPKITVHIFDAPPAGEQPVKNIPIRIATSFGNNINPNT